MRLTTILPFLLLRNLTTSSILPSNTSSIYSRNAETCDTCQINPAGYEFNGALDEELATPRKAPCKEMDVICRKTKHCCVGVCRRAFIFKYCSRPKRKKGKKKENGKKCEIWGSQEGDEEEDGDVEIE